MPFGMVSGVGRGMDVLDGVVFVEGKGSLGRGEFGASHCNPVSYTHLTLPTNREV